MPVRRYGVYLAYPPTVDLRAEGLGRHLAEFLKGALEREDVQFVIACPSWMRISLAELFEATDIEPDSFEIIAPAVEPLALRAYRRVITFRRRLRRIGRLRVVLRRIQYTVQRWRGALEVRLVSTRSVLGLAILAVVALPGLVLLLLTKLLAAGSRGAVRVARRAGLWLGRHPGMQKLNVRASTLTSAPKQDSAATRLYRAMEDAEASLMRELIEARRDITAWYSPTAFWPHFNDISAPRLTCVPDVVLIDFPVGFAESGGARQFESYKRLETTINGGACFVTYSAQVKWHTLVERFHVDPEAVHVIPHGVNRLDDAVFVTGFPDNEDATDTLCRQYFRAALAKAQNTPDATLYGSSDLRFVFYASQFRPNKNIPTLLRAYEHLLRDRYLGVKLVLTANFGVPEVTSFIDSMGLSEDVLFLHGLSTQELAACYRLADLAVNPSLSEGGCPFTFTEALSVGTPAVMARIAVTEEVISDPELQALMLFDPYDWRDMAERIEWALNHRESLLKREKPFYDLLTKRTWRNVVDEHVAILDRIASGTAALS